MQRRNLHEMLYGDRIYPDIDKTQTSCIRHHCVGIASTWDMTSYIQDLYYNTTCGNDHVWVKSHDPNNPDGCVACDRCGVFNQHMKTQFQEEGEERGLNAKNLWKRTIHLPIRTLEKHPQSLKRKADDQGRDILARMRTDDFGPFPKRCLTTARRLMFVLDRYPGDFGFQPRTRADDKFCRSWTAHRRNAFLKEFGNRLPELVRSLARRLPVVKRWRKFKLDEHYRRVPKRWLRYTSQDYRIELKKLCSEIRRLDPKVWREGWNMKKRHKLAFRFNGHLTKSQLKQLLACPQHPRTKRRSP